uniref:Beta-lactamase-related domain-containing protein n=1 Tax=Plectus sambesii TaxID=2011161 RepID=A0A914X3F3_9BILA
MSQSSNFKGAGSFIQGFILAAIVYCAIKWYLKRKKTSKLESAQLERKLVDGFVDRRFEKVFHAFRDNFQNGLEQEGAAICVFYQGKMVVDMWGGWSDREAAARWKQETLVNISTASRAIIAVSFAHLIDKESLHYGDLVTRVWPEYGQEEKQSTKIRMILDDTCGITNLDQKIERKHLRDWKKMRTVIENHKPDTIPGTKLGYAIFTSGFLADSICRKTDKHQRGTGDYFDAEIGKPHGLDVYLSLPSELEHRVARISPASKWSFTRRFSTSWRLANSYYNLAQSGNDSYFKKSLNSMEIGRFYLKGKTVLNNPEWRRLGLASIGGVASAKGLAKMMSLLIDGKLCGGENLDHLRKPKFQDAFDYVLHQKISRGHGFVYTKSQKGDWLIGFPGHGGSNVKADLKNQLAFAYVTNSQK